MITPKLIYVRHRKGEPSVQILKKEIPFCELTIVFKGTIEYRVNGERVTLRDGDAVFIPQGSVRERDLCRDDVDYISFNFSVDEELSLPIFLPNILTRDIRLLLIISMRLFKLSVHLKAHRLLRKT